MPSGPTWTTREGSRSEHGCRAYSQSSGINALLWSTTSRSDRRIESSEPPPSPYSKERSTRSSSRTTPITSRPGVEAVVAAVAVDHEERVVPGVAREELVDLRGAADLFLGAGLDRVAEPVDHTVGALPVVPGERAAPDVLGLAGVRRADQVRRHPPGSIRADRRTSGPRRPTRRSPGPASRRRRWSRGTRGRAGSRRGAGRPTWCRRRRAAARRPPATTRSRPWDGRRGREVVSPWGRGPAAGRGPGARA